MKEFTIPEGFLETHRCGRKNICQREAEFLTKLKAENERLSLNIDCAAKILESVFCTAEFRSSSIVGEGVVASLIVLRDGRKPRRFIKDCAASSEEWIKISPESMPTRIDADEVRECWYGMADEGGVVILASYNLAEFYKNEGYTHWMPKPRQLPPEPPEDKP